MDRAGNSIEAAGHFSTPFKLPRKSVAAANAVPVLGDSEVSKRGLLLPITTTRGFENYMRPGYLVFGGGTGISLIKIILIDCKLHFISKIGRFLPVSIGVSL